MVNLSVILIVINSIAFNTPVDEVSSTCLSEDEQKLFKIINAYREIKGLKAVPFSSSMTMVAQAHARDLAENYEFKKGARCNPHSWSKNGDWSDCCYTSDHKKSQCMWDKPKEIAGYEGYGYEILFYSSNGASSEDALHGWQNSPGHHAVMINLNIWEKVEWEALGIGIYGEYAAAWFGETKEDSPLDEIHICE